MALSAFDLTTPQYAALSLLGEEAGLSNAELARRSFVTPQTMIRVVVGLDHDGLIERSQSPDHGRILTTTLTIAGRHRLEEADKEVTRIERAMLDGLTTGEALDLSRLLTRLVENTDLPT